MGGVFIVLVRRAELLLIAVSFLVLLAYYCRGGVRGGVSAVHSEGVACYVHVLCWSIAGKEEVRYK